MDLGAPFRAGGSLAGFIAFVDDGAVEDVLSQRHSQEGGGVFEEFDWSEGGEGVEGCEEVFWSEMGGDISWVCEAFGSDIGVAEMYAS